MLCEPALAAALVAKGSDRADEFSMSRAGRSYVAIYERLSSSGIPQLAHRYTGATMWLAIVIVVIILLVIVYLVRRTTA